jgi:hypothetical protein
MNYRGFFIQESGINLVILVPEKVPQGGKNGAQ